MKNLSIRPVSFSDRVKGYSEQQFKAAFPHLTDQEKAFYLKKLGIVEQKPEKKVAPKSETEIKKGDE